MAVTPIEAAWSRFVEASERLTAARHGATGVAPRAFTLSMPIDWPAFYEFIVRVHELGEELSFDDVERWLVDAGLSEGEAEEVAGAYWVGREVLTASDERRRGNP